MTIRWFLPLLALLIGSTPVAAQSPLEETLRYIDLSWTTLSREIAQQEKAAADPKLEPGSPPLLYVPRSEFNRVRREISAPPKAGGLQLRPLPEGEVAEHGLLYLPHPYLVPGGRFNEMYGWDSYFINLGLLRSGRLQQARQMADNHLYQVRHYGKVLNANRTYYLNRSQPPLLASMVSDVYRYSGDKEWLEKAWPQLESTYRYWTSPPHLVKGTGLSRYYSLGDGPAPEVLSGETDSDGRNHYDKIKEAFREQGDEQLGYPRALYYDAAQDRLTPLFYKGDRTMRESGYDPSDRFGRFNIDVIHYLPVDLNCLLYLYEKEMGHLARELGRPQQPWLKRAEGRRRQVMKYLWNDQHASFFDHNFRTGRQRLYPFATTFFPLWTGLADPATASRIVEKQLPLLESEGGIQTSTRRSGHQWDAPFGWAPLQLIAVEGLRRYGYQRDADRIAMKFLSLVIQEFQKTGTIVEKYDVVARSSQVSADIQYGYSSNEVGFGWTNGVFLELLATLPQPLREKLGTYR